MSERKVLNKYYPPDFDPSKIPRMKLAKNRQYTVRLMAPFNMRCVTCGEYIYKGKKFNARKEDVEHETYLGIRIYRFYIKCTRCLQEISFKTDPQNTDYEIEAGATRNFMALKLAEEQARKELEEEKEEEANNPMKLLENRTQQSRNEIELLESLEELRDLNRRQQNVNYEEMLKQYNVVEKETPEQMEERQKRLDEEYVKQVKFQATTGSGAGVKRVAEEEVLEIEDLSKKQFKPSEPKKPNEPLGLQFKRPAAAKSIGIRASMANLVKRKTPSTATTTLSDSTSVSNATDSNGQAMNARADNAPATSQAAKIASASASTAPILTTNKPNALALLGSYADSDSNESD